MKKGEDKKVMVFGCFDSLHKGHQSFLKQAKSYGNLIVALTPDRLFKTLKNRKARFSFKKRKEDLLKSADLIKIVGGDTILSSYNVLDKYKPDIVVCGYDQLELKKDLKRHIKEKGLEIKVKTAKAYFPEKYHSSFICKN